MATQQATKTVYQYDETLRDLLTRITSIRPFSAIPPEEQALFKTATEKTRVLETTETVFYVQGGGQPFDTGYIVSTGDGEKEKRFHVESVRYGVEGRVLHFGHFSEDAGEMFQEGEMVQQRVDGARRDLNSRIHTAGHIVGLAVRRLAEKMPDLEVTEFKAQHYPDASFVDFKGIIDSKFKDAIQSQATQYVSSALPVKMYWHRPEELKENGVITAEGMPIVAGADGKVRVVDIVSAGAYPCGGTHVPDSSYVGSIVIRSIKSKKGVSKVSYAIAEITG